MLVLVIKYIRDNRSPIPKNETVSRVMSANKEKNTGPELTVRRALWRNGIRGYRLHSKKVIGKPDVAFIGKKIAVFIHGCFWHRCPYCKLPLPKSNPEYWKLKFERNIGRDKRNLRILKSNGWKVVIIWECEIKHSLDKVVGRISKAAILVEILKSDCYSD